MTQPIASIVPGTTALFVYEDKDRFGTAIRITVTVNGWTISRGGVLVANLRGAVMTDPVDAESITRMLTEPLPLVRFVIAGFVPVIDAEHLLSPYSFEDAARDSIVARIWSEFNETLAGRPFPATEEGATRAALLLAPILARMEREGVLTRKAADDDIRETHTSTLPQAGASGAATHEADAPTPSVQVAEDVARLDRALNAFSLGTFQDGLRAALIRIAAKAQGYDAAMAEQARLKAIAEQADTERAYAQSQTQHERSLKDAAVADNASLVADMKRAHIAAMHTTELPGSLPEVWEATRNAWLDHPGTALLERLQRLELALRRVGGLVEDMKPDTMAGTVQAIVNGALDHDRPDPVLEQHREEVSAHVQRTVELTTELQTKRTALAAIHVLVGGMSDPASIAASVRERLRKVDEALRTTPTAMTNLAETARQYGNDAGAKALEAGARWLHEWIQQEFGSSDGGERKESGSALDGDMDWRGLAKMIVVQWARELGSAGISLESLLPASERLDNEQKRTMLMKQLVETTRALLERLDLLEQQVRADLEASHARHGLLGDSATCPDVRCIRLRLLVTGR